MKTGEAGKCIIKGFESLRLKAYRCLAGVLTIGYGHTKGVTDGQIITPDDAEKYLEEDLQKFEKGVSFLCKVPLIQNRFDALVSFSFNVGLGALERSTLRMKLNRRDFSGASKELLKWDKIAGKKVKGLIRRREAEKKLFDLI